MVGNGRAYFLLLVGRKWSCGTSANHNTTRNSYSAEWIPYFQPHVCDRKCIPKNDIILMLLDMLTMTTWQRGPPKSFPTHVTSVENSTLTIDRVVVLGNFTDLKDVVPLMSDTLTILTWPNGS